MRVLGLQVHEFESSPRSECRLGFLTRANGFLEEQGATTAGSYAAKTTCTAVSQTYHAIIFYHYTRSKDEVCERDVRVGEDITERECHACSWGRRNVEEGEEQGRER
ncbi:hypothetical protein E2C01_052171 [Portunus trituberculatus]|uniref:Uncharacterized protein n=1 Tax=Portunus trituberculatus TaxID=210409 RepID=A0A5B7GKU9_PORTR|nr:hypothetical protein [Portunus trituberculatus]